jgi:hypothetical protein
MNLKGYRNLILPAVLYGCTTWISNPKGRTDGEAVWEWDAVVHVEAEERKKVTAAWKKFIMRSFMIVCYSSVNVMWVIT